MRTIHAVGDQMNTQSAIGTYLLSFCAQMFCTSDDQVRTLQYLSDEPAQRRLVRAEFSYIIPVKRGDDANVRDAT